jgi:DNA-binding NtrC family response regulator
MSADIFIIGADEATGSQIEAVLGSVGYKIQSFSGIAEALVELDAQTTHLVMIDTSTAGFEIGDEIESLQRIAPSIEILLITEYQDPLIEQDAKNHHVNRWLYRPFTAPEIILKVFSALEGASTVGPDGLADADATATNRMKIAKGPDSRE